MTLKELKLQAEDDEETGTEKTDEDENE